MSAAAGTSTIGAAGSTGGPGSPPPAAPAAPAALMTTGGLAALLRAELYGPDDLPLAGLAALEAGGPRDLTFIRSAEYAPRWRGSQCGAALVTQGVEVPGHDPARRALIIVPDADLALIEILKFLAPKALLRPPGVHPSSVVDATAQVDATAHVGPLCVVGPGATIGAGTVLMSGVTLGARVRVGGGCVLHPGVVVYDGCRLGEGVILHAGCIIGADGFGYLRDPRTGEQVKVPHIGIVEIHDRVEIGANTCVDRAKFGATVIGAGTKIDNLVQIGHNCRVGRDVIICGNAGLSGSVTVGDGAAVGAGAGVVDNLVIGANARLAGMAGVMRDVGPGETVAGCPAMEARRFFKAVASINRLAGTRSSREKRE